MLNFSHLSNIYHRQKNDDLPYLKGQSVTSNETLFEEQVLFLAKKYSNKTIHNLHHIRISKYWCNIKCSNYIEILKMVINSQWNWASKQTGRKNFLYIFRHTWEACVCVCVCLCV